MAARVRDLPIPITTAQLRRIAVRCSRDPRTVARYLRGDRVADVAVPGIRAALAAEGIPVPDAESEVGS